MGLTYEKMQFKDTLIICILFAKLKLIQLCVISTNTTHGMLMLKT